MTTEEVLQLKKRIDRVKTQYNTLTGEMNVQLSRLKSEFKCDSLPAAEALLNSLEMEVAELVADVEVRAKQLRENYPDLFN